MFPLRQKQPQRQRSVQTHSFPAPVGGWIANRNLANPNQPGLPPGASVLENWFPLATDIVMRRGKQLYATLGLGDLPTEALFAYKNGNQQKLYGATDTAIYDITTVSTAVNYMLGTDGGDTIVTDTGDTIGEDSTIGQEVAQGLTSGDWITVQFSTAGKVYLVLVNGADEMLQFDGTNWYPVGNEDLYTLAYDTETVPFTVGATLTGGTSAATATIVKVEAARLWLRALSGTFQNDEIITDSEGGSASADGVEALYQPGLSPVAGTVETSDFSYVWSYKNRLFFIEKDSLNAWYMVDGDAVGGDIDVFPLGGVFNRGGSLLFGAAWSIESDGLNAQCIFVTTEGEVAVYSGLGPEATDWTLVGVYRIGTPLGKQAHIRAGADIVIATQIGFIPLSQAVQRDFAALSPSAVSYPIEEAWNDAVAFRSGEEWRCVVWPGSQMVLVAPPTTTDQSPLIFAANARTGAWSKFTGWNATAFEVFNGQLYMGDENGKVYLANVTGTDDGEVFTSTYVPLFDDRRMPASLKVAQMARAVIRAPVPVREKVSGQWDFEPRLPSPPSAAPVPTGSVWGGGIWGESIWGTLPEDAIKQQWVSIGGTGYAMAVGVQVTSGAIVPIDAKLVRVDVTFNVADIVT